MEYLHIEVTSTQLAKRVGEVCGDLVRVTRLPSFTTVICCDGMGSGIRANTAATLHVARLVELENQGVSLRDAFARVVGTVHQFRGKNALYAALSVARIQSDGDATVLSYDAPPTIMIGAGHASKLPQRTLMMGDAQIGESHCRLSPGEGLLLVSDGITAAGLGGSQREGFGIDQVVRHVDSLVSRGAALPAVTEGLVAAAKGHWGARVGDDCSVVGAWCRIGRPLTVFTGPPGQREMDADVVQRFLAAPGWRVVCGATTAKLVAQRLGRPVRVMQDDPGLVAPPRYELEGIDLVTEGAVTLNQVYNILDADPAHYDESSGVTELCELFKAADRVHFIVGTTINPVTKSMAFQQRGILARAAVVRLLCERLTEAGKLAFVTYV